MESGLDGRNNHSRGSSNGSNKHVVSMESGLDGRNNNAQYWTLIARTTKVSMESGLDGRNNTAEHAHACGRHRLSQWSPA